MEQIDSRTGPGRQ
jgi:hypothetical protein